MKYPTRMSCLLIAAAVAVGAACGSDSGGAADTLPPIITTTTTTTMVPTTTTIPEYYEIQAGDSISGIAKMFNTTQTELAAYNGITDLEHIEIGQRIKIPRPGEAPASTVAAETTAPITTALITTAPITTVVPS